MSALTTKLPSLGFLGSSHAKLELIPSATFRSPES